jgi:soluble lytic murein transglycosylase-like protein
MNATLLIRCVSLVLRARLACAAILVLLVAQVFFPAQAYCFEEAGKTYNVNPDVLRAITKTESGGKAHAIGINKNGTKDIGLMQINSTHLTKLRNYGIGEKELLNPCTNVKVGAWILSDLIRRYGHSWNTIGAYNAGCSSLKGIDCVAARSRYAKKIKHHLLTQATGDATPVQ